MVLVQESEDDEPDAMEDETGSEETSSELRDDQTDTSSAEVPSARPRRAVTLRSSAESDRPPPTERARRSRRPQPHSYSEAEKCAQVKEVSMSRDRSQLTAVFFLNEPSVPSLPHLRRVSLPCFSTQGAFLYGSFWGFFCRKLSKKRKRSSSWTVIRWSGP